MKIDWSNSWCRLSLEWVFLYLTSYLGFYQFSYHLNKLYFIDKSSLIFDLRKKRGLKYRKIIKIYIHQRHYSHYGIDNWTPLFKWIQRNMQMVAASTIYCSYHSVWLSMPPLFYSVFFVYPTFVEMKMVL